MPSTPRHGRPPFVTAAPRTRLWIGPSGWSYDDWYGVVYPARRPRGFEPLAYIARYFNAVEVNSSFYRMPSARMTAGWPPKTPPVFRFAFKAPQIFTHERGGFPDSSRVAAFVEALRPVRDAGKLGPVLFQFPWSFRFGVDAAQWLRRIADAFRDLDRFVEVRHASWARPEALEVLRAVGGYCNIDQPALRDCLPPTMHVFGRSAYVRLHGRNAGNWFAEGLPPFERYNYLYSESELREWAERIMAASGSAEETYVFANNHYRGQGPANALELRALIEGERVDVPPELVATYPRLAPLASESPPGTLF